MTPEEITAEIDRLLGLPVPAPAEKHLLRERLVELFCLLHPDLVEPELGKEARAFAVAMVPQRLASYPMHLREKIMTVEPERMRKYEARLTYSTITERLESLDPRDSNYVGTYSPQAAVRGGE